ncbi:hypothetical protein T09_14941 [Trichinella sp. T9]|nr:hypothetical protein T09_14941 [Trichinella sp. T9]
MIVFSLSEPQTTPEREDEYVAAMEEQCEQVVCGFMFSCVVTNPMQGESMKMQKAVSTRGHEETECCGIRDPKIDEMWRWSETERIKNRKVSNRTATPGPALGGVGEVESIGGVGEVESIGGVGEVESYALGYALGKLKKIFALRLCLGLRLRQNFRYALGYALGKFKKYLPSGYAWGYASGKISAMPRANLKKYLPSGYASGYTSSNFFKIFKKIAQINALSYPSGYALGHPRGCLSFNN